jgi:SAM-dependent methyltransferase
METEEYRRLRREEERYWWHVGRRAMLAAMLRRDVREDATRRGADVGCGTGSNFALLAPYGRFFGTEIVLEACVAGDERPPRPVVLARGEELPFADGSIGLCTMFDVLEHVAAEDRFLSEVRRVLQPGGLILLSVPAYMFLWSDHDVSLHHHRRYVRRTLRESLLRNGLRPRRVTYAMASILAPVALVRGAGRLLPRRGRARSSYVPTPEPFNTLLAALLRVEAAWLATFDLPFGTSLLALAEKSA